MSDETEDTENASEMPERPHYHGPQVSIAEEMKTAYLDYAMSVIVSRALPDVRDGLKPSQRRILVAMNDLNLGPRSTHRKCAKIVGDTSGNYHPHGDQATYGTLVRMGQSWSMRYTLVDPQGNFGSMDADPPAAMRYTEARMAAAAPRTAFPPVSFSTYQETNMEKTTVCGKAKWMIMATTRRRLNPVTRST